MLSVLQLYYFPLALGIIASIIASHILYRYLKRVAILMLIFIFIVIILSPGFKLYDARQGLIYSLLHGLVFALVSITLSLSVTIIFLSLPIIKESIDLMIPKRFGRFKLLATIITIVTTVFALIADLTPSITQYHPIIGDGFAGFRFEALFGIAIFLSCLWTIRGLKKSESLV